MTSKGHTKWLQYMDVFSDILVEKRSELGERPNWDEFFLFIATMLGKMRGTCDRGYAGCVITKNNRILSCGYVGAASGMPQCDEVGHEFSTVIYEGGEQKQHCIRTAHAEQNAIVNAAREGISLAGSTIYVSMTPCDACARMIINAGIKKVVALRKYQKSTVALEYFEKLGIELVILNDDVQEYKK